MVFAKRTALLRLTALTGLVVSAALTGDHVNPGRAFCPLEAACEVARESALGAVMGIPTSVIGMAAFGALFLLTLLPIERSWKLMQPAGFLAIPAGMAFVAYQAFVLQSFCPLCVVADIAGFLAGVITLTWPPPPVLFAGRRLMRESGLASVAWTLVACLGACLPVAWPRPHEPSWVEITPLSESEFAFEPEAPASDAPVVPSHPLAAMPASPLLVPHPITLGAPDRRPARPDPASIRQPDVSPVRPLPVAPALPRAPVASRSPERVPEPMRSPVAPEPAPQPKPPLLVEYLNAYCAHCRATHKRLERVLAQDGRSVRRRRVYTWGGKDYPLWARACAFAQRVGREEQLFAELLRAPSQRPSHVYAAARRAGLKVDVLKRALADRAPPPRLVHDRRLVKAARIKVLPTLDIGSRRLMGEQSEAELRAALRVAFHGAGR